MNLKEATPELRDVVKHKNNDTAGVVIAKYHEIDWDAKVGFVRGKLLIDVRGDNDRIYYGTPIENWEVIILNNE